MPTRIRIQVGTLTLEGELNDSETARKVTSILPFEGPFMTWGDEFYFRIPVDEPESDDAAARVAVGDIGYWPTGSALCLFFGPTPASQSNEIRAASAVNIVGKLTGYFSVLWHVQDGATVSIEKP